MTESYELVKSLPVQNELGEGVFWDAAGKSIWWTDILSARIYQHKFEQDVTRCYSMPEPVGCFALTNQPDTIVCAFVSGFALYELVTGQINWLHKPELGADMRFNDGKTDRQGRFWAGTMHNKPSVSKGSLFCLDKGRVAESLNSLHISNGLCWSPDSQLMYHTDTPSRKIMRYAFDAENGGVGEASLFAELSSGQFPDGATVDALGNLYVAVWDGACVKKFSPEGEHLTDIALPVTRPTCVTFAGKNLDHLVVTSARQDLSQQALSAQPKAGDLFIFKAEARGIAEAAYNI